MKNTIKFFYPFGGVFAVSKYEILGLRVCNPFGVFWGFFSAFLKELRYAVKTWQTIKHKFIALESYRNYEWAAADEYDNPHYVCAKFGNGGHIPLPIIWHVSGFQGQAIKLACKYSNNALNNLIAAQNSAVSIYKEEALKECRHP